jgi:hypothetical protein
MSTTGVVDLGWDPAPIYIARWNPKVPAHGIAFLIGMGMYGGFVSIKYSFEINAFTVLDPMDYGWGQDLLILLRDEVIGTPLAAKVFQVIDEIWLHDLEIQLFCNRQKNPN